MQQCFQWTLVIDEIDFTRTRKGICQYGIFDNENLHTDFDEHAAIVAKIYIQKQSLDTKRNTVECFRATVNNSLAKVFGQNFNESM